MMPYAQGEFLIKFGTAVYHLNPYAMPVFLTSLVVLFLGLCTLVRERFSSVATAFFLMILPTVIWLFSSTGMYLAESRDVALWWAKAAYLGLPFIPPMVYLFTIRVLRLYEPHKKKACIYFALSALFSWILVTTDWMVKDLYHYHWGFYPKYEPSAFLYLAFFFGLLFESLWLYWTEYRKTQTDTHKARIKSLMVAFCIAFIAWVDYLPKFGIALYPFGFVGVLGFMAVGTGVVLRYRLVDITPSFAVNQIIGAMGDALLVLDAEDTVQVANQAAYDLFLLSKQEILGKSVSTVIPNFPIKDTAHSLERLGTDHGYELEHARGDGQRLNLMVTESAIKDHKGCIVATVLVLRDMTPLKETQTALKEIEHRCDELYRDIPEAIVLLDEFGRFRSVNPAAEKLLGVSESRVAGKIFVMSKLLPPTFMGRMLQVIRLTMEGKQEGPFDLELLTEGGNRLKLKAYPRPVQQNGKIAAVQLLLRDTTHDRQFEQAIENAKKEMIHEMQKRLDEFTKNHEELRNELKKLRFYET